MRLTKRDKTLVLHAIASHMASVELRATVAESDAQRARTKKEKKRHLDLRDELLKDVERMERISQDIERRMEKR